MSKLNKAAAAHRAVALLTVVMPTVMAVAAVAMAIGTGVTQTEILIVLIMHVICIAGVEMGFHRYFAHHSFKAGSTVKILLAICGSMAAQGPLTQWVCDHRKHHRFTDNNGDPHSPHVAAGGLAQQLWHAHIGWLFKRTMHDPTTYAKDLLRDPLLMAVSRHYHFWVAAGILMPGLVLYTLEDWQLAAMLKGVLYGGGLRIFLGHHAVWSVNSFGHYFGSRPFNTRERSRNNLWLVLPTLGGGWHNNHHANPASAVNAARWWQIDLIGLFILLLGKLGAVYEIRRINDGARDEVIAEVKRIAKP
jgi:stearoyl-CoA desaturase (delta-9 desaturase)